MKESSTQRFTERVWRLKQHFVVTSGLKLQEVWRVSLQKRRHSFCPAVCSELLNFKSNNLKKSVSFLGIKPFDSSDKSQYTNTAVTPRAKLCELSTVVHSFATVIILHPWGVLWPEKLVFIVTRVPVITNRLRADVWHKNINARWGSVPDGRITCERRAEGKADLGRVHFLFCGFLALFWGQFHLVCCAKWN